MSKFNPDSDSNRVLISAIQKGCPGLARTDIKSWLNVLATAMHNRIAEGKPFTLYKVGRFDFWRRSGRTTTWKHNPLTGGPHTVVQKPSLVLRFKAAKNLHKLYKDKLDVKHNSRSKTK